MEIYRKPWKPLRIEGKLAVWYNPDTKQHKKVFIRPQEIPEFRNLILEAKEEHIPTYRVPSIEGEGVHPKIDRGNITSLPDVMGGALAQDLERFGLAGEFETRKKGKVIEVYDGNTILVSDGRGIEVVVKVRGLYTEPLRKRGDTEDSPLALRQKETLESLVLGQEIELLYDVERLRDAQGTSLATIYLSGETPYPSTDLFTGAVTYRTEQLSELEQRDPRFNKNVKQLMLNRGMALPYEDRRELLLEEALKKKDIELQKKLDFVKAESKLPEEQRQRKLSDEFSGLDWLNYIQYETQAQATNAAVLLKTGKYGKLTYRDKLSAGKIFRQLLESREGKGFVKLPESIVDEVNWFQRNIGLGTVSLSGDIAGDPASFIGFGKGFLTKTVQVAGKSLGVTGKGAQLMATLVAKYGEAEAKWHFLAEVKKNPDLIQKEGLRIFWTNFELIPKKYMDIPYNYIIKNPISKFNRGASSAISKLTKQINELSLAESALRKYQYAKVSILGGKHLPDIPSADIGEIQSGFKSLMNEIRLKKQLASLEIDMISSAAKSELGKGFGTKLTNIVESGKFTTGKLRTIVDDLDRLHKRMASSEQARGLLGEKREFYVRHVLTPAAKKAMEIETKVLGALDIDASFSVGRKIEGSVADINRAYNNMGANFNLFEPDALKAIKIRYKESIQATETYDFLNGIKKTYGVDAKFFGELRNSHAFSKIPVLKDVLLPKNVIEALEGTTELRQHIKTLAPPKNIIRKGFDAYTGVRRTFQRTVTVWFAAFHSRNVISATAENAWKGVWNPLDYLKIEKSLKGTSDPIHNLIRKIKGGKSFEEMPTYQEIIFVSDTGEKFTNAKFLDIARRGNILDQPGYIDFSGFKPWEQHNGVTSLVEQVTVLPAGILKHIENRVRLTLLRQRLIIGDSEEQAIKFVNDAHIDYTRQLSELEKVGENVIPFYRWTTANPIIQAKKLVTHPGSFAAIPKATDAWHDEEDKIMLNYKPDYLQGAILVKLPGTEDAFARIPLATEDITMLVNNVRSENHAFYWDEALLNPDIVRRFARYNLDVDWLSRGGGVAEAVGNTIIITYKTTGASIIVQMASDGQTLEFLDGDTGMVLKSFNMDARRGKPEVMADNAPLKKLASRYMYPWFTAPGEIYTGEEWRFGREIDDMASYLFRKFGGSRAEFTVAELNDPTIPTWEKFMELVLGINVYHAADWIDLPEEIADEVIEKEIAAYRGSYSGCGFSY